MSTGTTNKRAVSAYTKKQVAYRQEYRCAWCCILLPPAYEVDHIVPLFRGGSNSPLNLQALCRNCHGEKSLQEREDFKDAMQTTDDQASSDEMDCFSETASGQEDMDEDASWETQTQDTRSPTPILSKFFAPAEYPHTDFLVPRTHAQQDRRRRL